MALIDRLTCIFRTTAYIAVALQVVALVLTTAAVGAVVLYRVNAVLGQQVVDTLRIEARGLADVARTGGRPALEMAIAERVQPGIPNLYILVDADNKKVAGNLNRWPPELDRHAGGGLFQYVVEEASGRTERLAAGLPVLLDNGVRLVVARDVEEQRTFADSIRNLVLGGLALITVAGILIGALVSRYVLKRISTVTAAAETIMAGDLSRRIPKGGSGDEIDDLAARLNAMLDRIEQLMAGLREISDNIAHDLKTPLNRLRNRAEAALRDPSGPEAHREALQRTIESADEIIRTFNALLLIARLEAGSEGATETFDVAEAVGDLAELYGPVADEGGFELAFTRAASVPLVGNRQLIVQAVANLIENALKYGGRDGRGTIAVSVDRKDRNVLIKVSDRGHGIPEADRARVLERFVRLEDSRTKPGTGLGLSLVAAVARLHGGEVRLSDNTPGLEVCLRLPARPDCPPEHLVRTDD